MSAWDIGPETSTLTASWNRLRPIVIAPVARPTAPAAPVHRRYQPISPGPRAKKGEIKHGTVAGYRTEVGRKLPRCAECKRANAEYAVEERARKRAA